jgi:hypothetical protein
MNPNRRPNRLHPRSGVVPDKRARSGEPYATLLLRRSSDKKAEFKDSAAWVAVAGRLLYLVAARGGFLASAAAIAEINGFMK